MFGRLRRSAVGASGSRWWSVPARRPLAVRSGTGGDPPRSRCVVIAPAPGSASPTAWDHAFPDSRGLSLNGPKVWVTVEHNKKPGTNQYAVCCSLPANCSEKMGQWRRPAAATAASRTRAEIVARPSSSITSKSCWDQKASAALARARDGHGPLHAPDPQGGGDFQ